MKLLMTLLEAIALILGAASPEELDAGEVERFSWMNSHPLKLNSMSRRELAESGLFSDFQTVSLLDYIGTSGPVLSRAELALVDGFDAETAEALSFFVTFGEPSAKDRWRAEGRTYADMISSASPAGSSGVAESAPVNLSGTYGAAAYVGKGHTFELSAGGAGGWKACVGTADGDRGKGSLRQELKAVKLSVASSLPGRRLSLYAGDFNLRFGQGLSLWNTMSLEDPSSASSLIRRPTGLKMSRSLTGNQAETGLGTVFEAGPLTFTLAASVKNLKPVLLASVNSSRRKDDVAGLQTVFNCNWWHRKFSLGFTTVLGGIPEAVAITGDSAATAVAVPEGVGSGAAGGTPRLEWSCTADFSADFRGCFRGFDLAAEAAGGYRLPFRAVVSAVSPKLAEHFRTGFSLRYGPVRHAAVLTTEYSSRSGHSASVHLRCRHRPGKSSSSTSSSAPDDFRADVRYSFRWGASSSASLRFRETWTPGQRPASVLHCRGDVSVGYGRLWTSTLLADFSLAGRWGMAAYAEQGCAVSEKVAAYLRAGIFSIDEWAGRIYIYERDVYGRFNVPALYGRGVWTSFFLNWRLFGAWRLSARLSYRSFPFMPAPERRPSRAEVRLMLVWRG